MESNFYSVLGIPFDASAEEIRSAFRELARLLHPDTNHEKGAAEKFMAVQKAYETLSDPKARELYDRTLPASLTTLPLKLISLYSRESLQPSPNSQVLYALLRISPNTLSADNPNPPLNICLVVDCSTSMQGVLLDTVKSTAIELVRQMRPQDIFSVVAFSDKAQVVVPANITQDRQRIESSIRLLQTSGGTEIYQGLAAGYSEVQRHRNPKYTNHVVLITDGRTYGDEDLCLRLAAEAGAQGIGISSLGIGGKWNDAFLDAIAAKTGGSVMFVAKPKDVEVFLRDKITGLGKSYANNLKLDLKLNENVELRYAFRLNPDTVPVETIFPLNLGPVPRQGAVEIILDLMVPPFSHPLERINIAVGRLYFEMPSQPEHTFSIRTDILRPVSVEGDPLAPPQAIVQAMSTLTLYRIQEKARKEVADGKYREATRRLQNIATHLLSLGQTDLARTVLGEANHIQNNASYSEIGEKRIKFGTRALLLPSVISEKPL